MLKFLIRKLNDYVNPPPKHEPPVWTWIGVVDCRWVTDGVTTGKVYYHLYVNQYNQRWIKLDGWNAEYHGFYRSRLTAWKETGEHDLLNGYMCEINKKYWEELGVEIQESDYREPLKPIKKPERPEFKVLEFKKPEEEKIDG